MEIDEQLAACGWAVQDYKHAAVAAAQGVAVREVPTDTSAHGIRETTLHKHFLTQPTRP